MDRARHCSDPSPPAGLGAESGQPVAHLAISLECPGTQPELRWGLQSQGPSPVTGQGPTPLPLMLHSSQGTLVTGFLENWSMQVEASDFSV